jgi:hypothetical protein
MVVYHPSVVSEVAKNVVKVIVDFKFNNGLPIESIGLGTRLYDGGLELAEPNEDLGKGLCEPGGVRWLFDYIESDQSIGPCELDPFNNIVETKKATVGLIVGEVQAYIDDDCC